MLYSRVLGLVAKSDEYFNYVWNPQHPKDYAFLSSDELRIFHLFTDEIADFGYHPASNILKGIEKTVSSLSYKGVPICVYSTSKQSLSMVALFCWGNYVLFTYEFGFSLEYVWLLFDRKTYEFLGSMSRYAKCVNTEEFARIIMVLKEIDFT